MDALKRRMHNLLSDMRNAVEETFPTEADARDARVQARAARRKLAAAERTPLVRAGSSGRLADALSYRGDGAGDGEEEEDVAAEEAADRRARAREAKLRRSYEASKAKEEQQRRSRQTGKPAKETEDDRRLPWRSKKKRRAAKLTTGVRSMVAAAVGGGDDDDYDDEDDGAASASSSTRRDRRIARGKRGAASAVRAEGEEEEEEEEEEERAPRRTRAELEAGLDAALASFSRERSEDDELDDIGKERPHTAEIAVGTDDAPFASRVVWSSTPAATPRKLAAASTSTDDVDDGERPPSLSLRLPLDGEGDDAAPSVPDSARSGRSSWSIRSMSSVVSTSSVSSRLSSTTAERRGRPTKEERRGSFRGFRVPARAKMHLQAKLDALHAAHKK
eukprot:PLAT217.27.p1 GENE.PLAT217.27~~PLAT217.27.p1  ORF type:complete len:454 (+),score=183.77 PLAT217.27:190-1362(+)